MWQHLEMRYTRQDTTIEDERKVENILKRWAWQWDGKNMFALSVVVTAAFHLLIDFCCEEYEQRLPTIAKRAAHYDLMLRQGMELSLRQQPVGDLSRFVN